MRKYLIAALFLCTTTVHAKQVVLSIGRSYEWAVPRGAQITVSNGAIVRAADLGPRLKIVGKRVGSAVVRAGQEQIDVHVLAEPERRLYDRLEGALSKMRGLALRIEGNAIFLDGRLLRLQDWIELSRAAGGATSKYAFQAELSPELRVAAAAHFNRVFRDAHLPELPIALEPSFVVTVPTEPADLRTRVDKTMSAYGFRVNTSPSALSLEPMVRVKLIVAEIRKSSGRTLGIGWPGTESARLLPGLSLPSELNVTLHALEEKGFAKVLASPTILCRSGKEAQFLAGGEFPIKVINHKSRDITWKKYGVMLKIRPLADYSGRMSIGIETEVSQFDRASSVDGVPGLMTNRIETHFDLSAPRTIVLSGLIRKTWSENTKGLPGLASLPILGPLFGSKDFNEDQSELVVFVTPELARPDRETL